MLVPVIEKRPRLLGLIWAEKSLHSDDHLYLHPPPPTHSHRQPNPTPTLHSGHHFQQKCMHLDCFQLNFTSSLFPQPPLDTCHLGQAKTGISDLLLKFNATDSIYILSLGNKLYFASDK